MGQGTKRLAEMRRNPRGDWSIDDVKVVCHEYGIELRPPSSGSHYKISHAGITEILTIPARRPIKPIYIRRLVALIERVTEQNNEL